MCHIDRKSVILDCYLHGSVSERQHVMSDKTHSRSLEHIVRSAVNFPRSVNAPQASAQMLHCRQTSEKVISCVLDSLFLFVNVEGDMFPLSNDYLLSVRVSV